MQKRKYIVNPSQKKSTSGTLSYNDAGEEGLCFGWIDSKLNKLDNETYKLLYSPRKSKSVWSKINKAKIEWLIKEGLMHQAGLAVIEAAKQNGSWKAIDDIEEFKTPVELQKALNKNKIAKKYFETFSPSVRKQIMQWVAAAKQAETKAKRLKETVELAAKISVPISTGLNKAILTIINHMSDYRHVFVVCNSYFYSCLLNFPATFFLYCRMYLL